MRGQPNLKSRKGIEVDFITHSYEDKETKVILKRGAPFQALRQEETQKNRSPEESKEGFQCKFCSKTIPAGHIFEHET